MSATATHRLIDATTNRTVGHATYSDVRPGDLVYHGTGRRFVVRSVRRDPDAIRVWVDALSRPAGVR